MRSSRRDAASLAAGYSHSHRKIEILSILLFTTFFALDLYKLWGVSAGHKASVIFAGFLLGWVAADFISGLVHWAADTWGSVDWPIIGQSLIRTFREHHVDPQSITRHDFVETNGDSCLITFPLLFMISLVDLKTDQNWRILIFTGLQSLAFWVLMTNQVHKWSHMAKAPKYVIFLQRLHILLPAEQHWTHHREPFATNYCITNGWLNPILMKAGFFRRFENLVFKTTGAIPRHDDLGREQALQVYSKLNKSDIE